MTRSRPGSLKPKSFRNSIFSVGSNSAISASIAAQMDTTIAPSAFAIFSTVAKYGLCSNPFSSTLAIYMMGLAVNNCSDLMSALLASSVLNVRAGAPLFICSMSFSIHSFSIIAGFCPLFAFLMAFR